MTKPARRAIQQGPSPGGPAAARAILLVDDDVDQLELLSRFLETAFAGVRIQRARSAEEGLQIMEKDPPIVVVSDYGMPGMDGLTFLRTVRELDESTLRILYTARDEPELETEAAREAGAILVRKRPNPVQLLELVRRQLAPRDPGQK